MKAMLHFHAGAPKNSTGLDLTVPTMREPLMAALASTAVPVVPEFNTQNTASAFAAAHASYQKWSKTAVAERAVILRRAADTMLEQTPAFCALLVKEAHKTWGDAISEVREAVDFLRYYADEAERIMQPMAMPQVHGAPFAWAKSPPHWPPATPCWPNRSSKPLAWPAWCSPVPPKLPR